MSIKRTSPLLAPAALALAGCSAVHPPAPPIQPPTPPSGWEEAAAVEGTATAMDVDSEKGWWGGFADPALDRVVRAALTDNHDLAAAAARVDAALAQARIAEIGRASCRERV